MDSNTASTVQKMIDRPTDAWMAALPILFIAMMLGVLFFCYQLWRKSANDSARREEQFFSIMTTHGEKLGDLGQLVSKNTEAIVILTSNSNQLKEDVDDIKDVLGMKKGGHI